MWNTIITCLFNSGLETIPIQTGSTSKLKQLHWKKFFKILLPSVLGTMPDPGQAHEIEDM